MKRIKVSKFNISDGPVWWEILNIMHIAYKPALTLELAIGMCEKFMNQSNMTIVLNPVLHNKLKLIWINCYTFYNCARY